MQGEAVPPEPGQAEGRSGEGQCLGARGQLPRPGNVQADRVLCHTPDSSSQPQSQSQGTTNTTTFTSYVMFNEQTVS